MSTLQGVPTPGTGRARRGFTLIEILVVAAIAVVLMTVVYRVFISGLIRGEEMTEEHKLLTDVRSLFEQMSRDVSAAHLFLPPVAGEPKQNLCLVRYVTDDAQPRLSSDNGPSYPFFNDGTEGGGTGPATLNLVTKHTMAVNRIQYRYDREHQTVLRTEEAGKLTSGSTANDPRTLREFTFEAGSPPPGAHLDSGRRMAGQVTQFDLYYMAYDEKGVKFVTAPADLPRTACLGVVFRAAQESGAYARRPGEPASRRTPVVEMATKMWSQRRLSEAAYPEYSSSVDEDLRY